MKKFSIKRIRPTKRFFIETIQTIFILALFAGLGIWYAYGSRAGDAERVALQYFEYFLTGNYEKMYDMVDVVESGFVNEKYYTDMMDAQAIMGGISDYEIRGMKSSGELREYAIDYVRKDGEKGTFSIVLEKQPEKTYLLFPTWKVNINNLILERYTVGIPADLNGTIDGIPLDEYYDNTSLDGKIKYYVLLHMLSGEHTLTIAGENIATYNETVFIEPADNEREFSMDEFSMVASEEKEVLDYAKYVIQQMYEHALEGEDFSAIQDMFANSEKQRAAIGYLYDSMVDWTVGEDGARLQTFAIDKISSSINKYDYPSNVTVRVKYDYSYTALEERTMLTANQTQVEGNGQAKATIYFRRDSKNKWKIIRVVMKLPDYSGAAQEE